MEKMALEMKIRLEESLKREADAKEREKEASERKDDILKRELEAQKAAGGQGGGGTWKRDQHSLFFFRSPG